SGGSFDQGFWSAAISSVVSTFVQTGGVKVFGSGDVATVLYGTVSGGLSAELTGGNFWQGAATGLVVSGLNHVAHRMMVKSIVNARIDGQSDGTGMNPDDLVPNTPDELLFEATRVKECLPELVRLDTEANFPGIELGR